MLKLELESCGNKYRIWSEENDCYVLREGTELAVINYFRQQSVVRADIAVEQYVKEAKIQGICPPRRTRMAH